MLLVASASVAKAVIPTSGAGGGVLVDRIGGRVVVDRRRHVELVDVADGDREGLRRSRAVRRGRRHRDVDASAAVSRSIARRRPSRRRCWHRSANAPPALLDQRVGHGVVGGIGVRGEGGDPDQRCRPPRSRSPHWPRRVVVDRRRHVELVDVVDGDGEGLRRRRAVGRGRRHLDVASWRRSLSRLIAAAVVTTPVLASMANRPPGLLGQRVGHGVVGRIGVRGEAR